MHRRRKSKDDLDLPNGLILVTQHDDSPLPSTSSTPPDSPRHRHRVQSSPTRPVVHRSLSSGHEGEANHHTLESVKSNGIPLHGQNGSAKHGDHHHSHSRTRSISSTAMSGGKFTPPIPSPLSTGFPGSRQPDGALLSPTSDAATSQLSPSQLRRHSRIHSRNLSIFFPRPGSVAVPAIAEDGSQEVEYSKQSLQPPQKDVILPEPNGRSQSAPQPRKKLGEGFKFGSRPPETSDEKQAHQEPNQLTSRRGHHHKHSVSHNFFSFLEPGAADPSPATATSASWESNSSYPQSAPYSQSAFASPAKQDFRQIALSSGSTELPKDAIVCSTLQFLLGALVWVAGQSSGSLACTGLGYWMVFDAFGIVLSKVLPPLLARSSPSDKSGRSYGNSRLETVALFSQSIYLIFASVYILKETIEHVLLSAGDDVESHHHHHGADVDIIDYPRYLIVVSVITLALSSLCFDNHARLSDVIGNRLPFSRTYFRSIITSSRAPVEKRSPSSKIEALLTNPYSVAPLLFAFCLLLVALLVPERLHRPTDLLLATLEVALTFSVSQPAATALGKVLLQTSPPRGMIYGRVEAFQKIMRELERHPDIISVPPPHIWQLTAPSHTSYEKGRAAETLVVTLRLHVNADLDDETIIQLTRWTHERVTSALGGSGVCEVTVGVIRD